MLCFVTVAFLGWQQCDRVQALSHLWGAGTQWHQQSHHGTDELKCHALSLGSAPRSTL